MKRIFIISLLVLIVALTGQTALGDSSPTKTFYGLQKVSLSVDEYDEQQVLTFPEKPLNFISKVAWEVSFEKKGIITNKKASIQIEVISISGKAEKIVSLNPEHKVSGELTLQPGQICRLKLYGGKYNSILKKYGAKLDAVCTFQKSQVSVYATEMNRPGRFKLDVVSIPAVSWTWTLPDGNQVNDNTLETSFSTGLAVIQLSSPQTNDTFHFDLQIPETVETNPSISPLEGYEDLTVRCFANATSHYQSLSKYLWDFGDGSAVKNTEQTEHTYNKPGVYSLRLKVLNSLGPIIEKAWDIHVLPFTINNNATVTPGRGPVPLTFLYKASPEILGTEPTFIQYLWNFGDGSTSNLPSGEHVYRKVGDYSVRLTITDKNHPNLKIEPWIYTVTVTPPVLTLRADASDWSGSIPLRVKFHSVLQIDGGPTEVEYYWDFNDGTFSSEMNPFHTFTDPGHYQVRLVVTDRIYGTVVSRQIPVDVRPPELFLKVVTSEPSGIIPMKVNFTPILDIHGGPTRVEYLWDFGDGTYDRTYSSAPISHSFTQPGLYTVKVIARDRIYRESATSQVRIEAKSPVVISRCQVTPLSGNSPLQIQGMGNADVKGYPSRPEYTWFIDGQRYSTDRDFRYSFTKPGTYKVTVTINDILPGHTGRDTQSWNITVQGNPGTAQTTENPPVPPIHKPTPSGDQPPAPSPSPTPNPVKDTKAPELTVTLSPNKLVPPNHKMIQITADIQVKDDQDPDPDIRLVSITCNQTIDPTIDISGVSFNTDDRSFFLRAETDRNKHEDRIYTVTYSATDSSGNSKTVTSTVIVPFSERNDRDDRNPSDDKNNGRDFKHQK
jgi:PKD repeat protein